MKIMNEPRKGLKKKKTESESLCAAVSKIAFLNEFVFDELVYKAENNQELELADLIIDLGQFVLVIQIKERNKKVSNEKAEQKWMDETIFNKAISQLKISIKTLKDKKGLSFVNKYGDKETFYGKTIIPIVIFLNNSIKEYKRSYTSKSLEMKVNIFSFEDFEYMCETIFLPIELLDYLKFRYSFLQNDGIHSKRNIDEQQDLFRENLKDGTIKTGYESHMIDIFNEESINNAIILNPDILKDFKDKVLRNIHSHMTKHKSYYRKILIKILLLPREDILEYVKMFNCALQLAKTNELNARLFFTRETNDEVFLICVHNNTKDWNERSLIVINELYRYKFKKLSCFATHFLSVKNKQIDIAWGTAYNENVWEQDTEKDELFASYNGLRR